MTSTVMYMASVAGTKNMSWTTAYNTSLIGVVSLTKQTILALVVIFGIVYILKCIYWMLLYPFLISPLRGVPGPKVCLDCSPYLEYEVLELTNTGQLYPSRTNNKVSTCAVGSSSFPVLVRTLAFEPLYSLLGRWECRVPAGEQHKCVSRDPADQK